jgi:hypothetical protein
MSGKVNLSSRPKKISCDARTASSARINNLHSGLFSSPMSVIASQISRLNFGDADHEGVNDLSLPKPTDGPSLPKPPGTIRWINPPSATSSSSRTTSDT